MSTKPPAAPEENDHVPDGWSDLSEEERAELHREADEAEAEYVRSECIPLDDVLPRYRQAG